MNPTTKVFTQAQFTQTLADIPQYTDDLHQPEPLIKSYEKIPSIHRPVSLYSLLAASPSEPWTQLACYKLVEHLTSIDTSWDMFLSIMTKKVNLTKLSYHNVPSHWRHIVQSFALSLKILVVEETIDNLSE